MKPGCRFIIAIVVALAATGEVGAAQEGLLPAQIGAWQQIAWQKAEATNLEQVAGAKAGVLREYGARRAEQATYRRGPAEWRVSVYEMADRSGAYGAFTLLGAGGSRGAAGEAGRRRGDTLTFYQSNYYVQVEGNLPPTDLGTLTERLGRLGGQQAGLPTLPGYLPRQGLVVGSDRYLLGPLALEQVAPLAPGDWAGFAYGAEAEAARYRLASAEATLILLSYPTPQIAADRLRDFERLFNLNGTGAPGRPLVFAQRRGSLVAVVAGTDATQAAALIGAVGYERELSWSDPAPGPRELNWGLTVANIMVATGVLLLFALASGVAFGLVRLLTKRLLPGKVFDRPEDSEIIQLDLTRRF